MFVIGQCLCSQTVEHEVEFDPLHDGQSKSSIIVPAKLLDQKMFDSVAGDSLKPLEMLTHFVKLMSKKNLTLKTLIHACTRTCICIHTTSDK